MELEDLSRSETSAFLDKEEQLLSIPYNARNYRYAMDWPVEVNYHEAKAFCNWKALKPGKRRGCQLKRNGTGCGSFRKSRISPTGRKRPEISIWSIMPRLVGE